MVPHALSGFAAWEGERSRMKREDVAAKESYKQGDFFEASKRCEGSGPETDWRLIFGRDCPLYQTPMSEHEIPLIRAVIQCLVAKPRHRSNGKTGGRFAVKLDDVVDGRAKFYSLRGSNR